MNLIEVIPMFDAPFEIVPSDIKRDWMDLTSGNAYTCPPLSHANKNGWCVILKQECVVEWNGGDNREDVKILSGPIGNQVYYGTVTFTLPFIFKTSKDFVLWCSGQPNYIKKDAVALTTIVDTSWFHSPFQFSWKLTKPGKIIFEKDTPVMFFMPYPKNIISDTNIVQKEFDPNSKTAFILEQKRNFIDSFNASRLEKEDGRRYDHMYRDGKMFPEGEQYEKYLPRPQKIINE